MVSCCQAQAIESVETEDLQRKWLQCFRKCWVSITSTNRILGPKRGVLDVLQSSWSWDLEAARGYLAQYYVKWKVATSIWSKDFVCVVEICRIMINVGFTQCHLHHPPKKLILLWVLCLPSPVMGVVGVGFPTSSHRLYNSNTWWLVLLLCRGAKTANHIWIILAKIIKKGYIDSPTKIGACLTPIPTRQSPSSEMFVG